MRARPDGHERRAVALIAPVPCASARCAIAPSENSPCVSVPCGTAQHANDHNAPGRCGINPPASGRCANDDCANQQGNDHRCAGIPESIVRGEAMFADEAAMRRPDDRQRGRGSINCTNGASVQAASPIAHLAIVHTARTSRMCASAIAIGIAAHRTGFGTAAGFRTSRASRSFTTHRRCTFISPPRSGTGNFCIGRAGGGTAIAPRRCITARCERGCGIRSRSISRPR